MFPTSFKLSATALALSALTLASCGPSDPYAHNSDPNLRTNNGALYGAIIGGMAGGTAAKDNKLLGAATGAALGAVVGGVIGSELDKQAADLRAQLGASGITVTNMGDYLKVNTPSDLLFTVDSASVNPSLLPMLAAVAQNLNAYPHSTIEVVGHTDNSGSAAYNMDLSQRRASSVAGILISDGVASSRVAATGRGEDQPIASNLTAEGMAQNRRVEILIHPTN